MAYKSHRVVGIVEGIPTSEIIGMVAVWHSHIHICCVSRRASGSFLEGLQVSWFLGALSLLFLVLNKV